VAGLVAVQGAAVVVAAYTELQTALRTILELVPKTAAYIDENRSLFTADGLQAHRTALTTIYGTPPDYFESIRYGSSSDEIFITQLSTSLKHDPDPLVIETLAVELWVVLEHQSTALMSAESDALSNESILSAAERETYFTLRSEVRAAQALLGSKITTARTAERQVATKQAESATPAVVSDFQAVAASRQVELLESVTSARRVVAEAEQGVAAAAAVLLEVRAPVAGTIGGQLVPVGSYVTPGTPVFTLYGAGARELEVTAPIRLVTLLSTGQAFTVAGKTVGVVDRWVLAGPGVVSVTVQLSEEIPIGTLLTGMLELDLPEDWYALPTDALEHAQGTVLVYRGDEQMVVDPQYIFGDTWFVTSESGLPTQVERVGGMNISRSE
jgi:hypothetical protein